MNNQTNVVKENKNFGTLCAERLTFISYYTEDAIIRDAVVNVLKHNHNIPYVQIIDEGDYTDKIEAIIPEGSVDLLARIIESLIMSLQSAISRRDEILSIVKKYACAKDGEYGKNDTYWFGDGDVTRNHNGSINADKNHFSVKIPYDGEHNIMVDHLVFDISVSLERCELGGSLTISKKTCNNLRKLLDELHPYNKKEA